MKARMTQSIDKMASRFDALSVRERVLILATIITLLFVSWDHFLMSPLAERKSKTIVGMQGVGQQLERIASQVTSLSEKRSKNTENQLQKQISDIKHLLVEAKEKQTEATGDFVPPDKMISVLRELLEAEKGLQLTSLKSLGTTSFQEKVSLPKNTSVTLANETNANAIIYKHGLQVVFEGDFFSTLRYLQALESMPWHFHWDTVDYQVLDFPRARVSIIVHTLSLNAWWIDV